MAYQGYNSAYNANQTTAPMGGPYGQPMIPPGPPAQGYPINAPNTVIIKEKEVHKSNEDAACCAGCLAACCACLCCCCVAAAAASDDHPHGGRGPHGGYRGPHGPHW